MRLPIRKDLLRVQQFDQWHCDWQEGFEQVDREIAEIMKEIEKEKKEKSV